MAHQVPDILRRILARKVDEVVERAAQLPLRELSARCESLPPPRGFAAPIVFGPSCLKIKKVRAPRNVQDSRRIFCYRRSHNQTRRRTARRSAR